LNETVCKNRGFITNMFSSKLVKKRKKSGIVLCYNAY